VTVKKRTAQPFSHALIPSAIAMWVLPLCKALHNGNYAKIYVMKSGKYNYLPRKGKGVQNFT
jgi:hypothetical protein